MTKREVIALGADEEEIEFITWLIDTFNVGGGGGVVKYGVKGPDGWLK